MTVDFQHLIKYGYAPGNYMSMCRTCDEIHIDLDKRAINCRTCAESLYAASAKPPAPKYTLRVCPFCGHQPEEENLYDSVHRVNREGTLWTAGCVDNEGGCNASVLGGSREHAVSLWNTRAGEDRTLVKLPDTPLRQPRFMVVCETCSNKRCPRAGNAMFKCTNSNAAGQVGELDAQPSGD